MGFLVRVQGCEETQAMIFEFWGSQVLRAGVLSVGGAQLTRLVSVSLSTAPNVGVTPRSSHIVYFSAVC